MKKLASEGIALLCIILITLTPASAQELALSTNKEIFWGSENRDSSRVIRYINDVNGKVLRSFRRSFGEKPGVVWAKTKENEFVAVYKEDNRTNYVYLSNGGVIKYTVSHYTEDQLSKDVRHIVRSNFYDDAIIHVAEVHKEDCVWFFVTVMDKTSVKTVKVTGGEWEVVKI